MLINHTETQKKQLKHLKNLSVGSSIISAEKPKSLEMCTQEIKSTPFKALQTKYFPSCIPLNLYLMKLEKQNATVKGSLLSLDFPFYVFILSFLLLLKKDKLLDLWISLTVCRWIRSTVCRACRVVHWILTPLYFRGLFELSQPPDDGIKIPQALLHYYIITLLHSWNEHITFSTETDLSSGGT